MQVINGLVSYNSPNQTYRYTTGPLKRFGSFPKVEYLHIQRVGVGKIQKFLYLYTDPPLYDPDVAIPPFAILKKTKDSKQTKKYAKCEKGLHSGDTSN